MTSREPLRVVVCDDERGRREGWKEDIESVVGERVEIEVINEWAPEWDELLRRRREARPPTGQGSKPLPYDELPDEDGDSTATAFDRADVLLIDYDLFGFDPMNYLTGAVVSYVVRCYSECKVIVSVNQYGSNPFDLSLRPDAGAFADVSIGEEQVANVGLWTGEAVDGFRPWAWPPLLNLAASHRGAGAHR